MNSFNELRSDCVWFFILKEGSFMFFIIPLVLLIGSLLDNSVFNTTDEGFVYVNSDVLSWNTNSNINSNSIAQINWCDIARIKFEKNAISFYQKNSFKTFLNLDAINQEQKEKLYGTVSEIAIQKNIKLVT